MTDFLTDWGLILVTFLPLAGALVMMAVPRELTESHKVIALVASGASLVMGILLIANFDYDDAGALQFLVDKEWIPLINSGFILGVDGISLPLMALTLLVVPLVIIYSWNHIPSPGNPKAFLALILILETGMIGTFAASGGGTGAAASGGGAAGAEAAGGAPAGGAEAKAGDAGADGG